MRLKYRVEMQVWGGPCKNMGLLRAIGSLLWCSKQGGEMITFVV